MGKMGRQPPQFAAHGDGNGSNSFGSRRTAVAAVRMNTNEACSVRRSTDESPNK